MRRIAALVLMCGCGDDVLELDAATDAITDAAVIDPDAVQIDASVAACVVGAAPMHPPVVGTYCATWTRIDGVQDPFARYYDRADVSLTSVHWYASDGMGQKAFDASASVQAGCLRVNGFSGNGGAQFSDPIDLCWSSEPRACGAMTWRTPPIGDGHWTVQLDACP